MQLAADDRPINPLHILSRSSAFPHQEVHVVKVTSDTVHVESGPINDSLAKRVASKVSGLASIDTALKHDTQGPPPPSPPASDEVRDEQSRIDRDRTMSSTTVRAPEVSDIRTPTKASVQTLPSQPVDVRFLRGCVGWRGSLAWSFVSILHGCQSPPVTLCV